MFPYTVMPFFRLIFIIPSSNSAGVKYYGEAEFWFSFVKVVSIVGLIILGLILDLGGGPDHDRIGFRYWKDPGLFNQFNDIQGAKGRFIGLFYLLKAIAFNC
jgi:yeast amino acid transporter